MGESKELKTETNKEFIISPKNLILVSRGIGMGNLQTADVCTSKDNQLVVVDGIGTYTPESLNRAKTAANEILSYDKPKDKNSVYAQIKFYKDHFHLKAQGGMYVVTFGIGSLGVESKIIYSGQDPTKRNQPADNIDQKFDTDGIIAITIMTDGGPSILRDNAYSNYPNESDSNFLYKEGLTQFDLILAESIFKIKNLAILRGEPKQAERVMELNTKLNSQELFEKSTLSYPDDALIALVTI